MNLPKTCPSCGKSLPEEGVTVVIEDYHEGLVGEDGELGDCRFTQCGDNNRAICHCGHVLYMRVPESLDLAKAEYAMHMLELTWSNFINSDTLELDPVGDAIREAVSELGCFISYFKADVLAEPDGDSGRDAS